MKLTYENNRWEMISSFQEKDEIKAAGFRWEPTIKRWYTAIPDIAAKFINVADERAKEEIGLVEMAIAESRSADAVTHIEIPAPEGFTFYPYQQAGIAFACDRDAVLIGDEMGLGKTPQSIGVINVTKPRTVLIICPATLKLNWKRELNRWLTDLYHIQVVKPCDPFPTQPGIVIINYDILHRHQLAIRKIGWDLLIADEAHYLKNPKAQRTRALFGGGEQHPVEAEKKILLTGTPITNRPIEIYPLASYLWPTTFNNWYHFAKRYCDAHNDGYGLKSDGHSNMEELQRLLRANGMIRRLKSQVLTELPPKTRQILVLPSDTVKHLIHKEQQYTLKFEKEIKSLKQQVARAKAQKNEASYKDAVAALRQIYNVAFEEMAAIRKELAIAKIPFTIEYVQSIIDEGTKVVVMAHHRQVVDEVFAHFGLAAVKLYGGMSSEDKEASVFRFQNDPSCTVFVGSISAAGVGITLTAAEKMVFAELDWTPANMLQAEDRIHRIGLQGAAHIWQLVFDGSLDSKMAETLVRKMKVIETALDTEAAEEPVDIYDEV